MTGQAVRNETTKMALTAAQLGVAVAAGVWLLLLFGLALAWDPLDRRLGFHARRRLERLSSATATMHERIDDNGGERVDTDNVHSGHRAMATPA